MSTFDGAAMPGDASTTQIQDRTESFRSALGARQQAETILAEAAEMRRQAALQAELLVAEAESLGRELTDRARHDAEQVTAAARERADGIVAQARAAAEEIRRQAVADAETARAEHLARLEAENRERLHGVRHRAEELLTGMETVVRGLGRSLQQAEGSVAEVERSLHLVRTDTLERLPDTPAGPAGRELGEAAEATERGARTDAVLSELADRRDRAGHDDRPGDGPRAHQVASGAEATVPLAVAEQLAELIPGERSLDGAVEIVADDELADDELAEPVDDGRRADERRYDERRDDVPGRAEPRSRAAAASRLAHDGLPEVPGGAPLDDGVQRPLGWLFRSARP